MRPQNGSRFSTVTGKRDKYRIQTCGIRKDPMVSLTDIDGKTTICIRKVDLPNVIFNLNIANSWFDMSEQ